MSEIAIIQRKIYEIRGQKVILDISSQFVTTNEDEVLRSQFVTLKGKGKNIKYLPYAFTEHGVIMLAS